MSYRMVIFFGDFEVAQSPIIAPTWIKGTYEDEKIAKEIKKLGTEMIKRKLITSWKIEILPEFHFLEKLKNNPHMGEVECPCGDEHKWFDYEYNCMRCRNCGWNST